MTTKGRRDVAQGRPAKGRGPARGNGRARQPAAPTVNRGGLAVDRRAEFETEMLPHMPRLFSFARRLTGSQEQAEDVVQEAYMRAWRFYHRFESGTNSRAWLFKILHNVFLNTRKPSRLREVQMPEDEGMGDFLLYTRLVHEGGWKDPLDISPEKFDHMFGDEVKRALDRLPATYRFPLLLCDVEGMSYETIAKVIGIPGGTVRSRLFRGRAILQRELVEYARKQGILKPGRIS